LQNKKVSPEDEKLKTTSEKSIVLDCNATVDGDKTRLEFSLPSGDNISQ
jgi:hypothetical protein